MVIRHRDDARRMLGIAITLGRGTTFSIYDVMDEDQWVTMIGSGDAAYVVGGALTGALEGLRRNGATAGDVLSCPTMSPGGVVSEEDMAIAAGWLADGLLQAQDIAAEQSWVTATLHDRGWVMDPARVTSLVLSIAVTAGHAVDHDRQSSQGGGQ